MGEPGDSPRPRHPAGADQADEPEPRLRLDIVHDAGDWSDFGQVEEAIEVAASAVGRSEVSLPADKCLVCVALSSDADVANLNQTWRGKPKPTNVLSFPAPEPPPGVKGPRHIGDVILAAETILAEARDLGIPAAHHLQHLVVHGILHLAGYDHEDDAEATVMEALETLILARIGVADPYAADTGEQ